MDFFLNLDFLIQLKMIKMIKRDEIDVYFQSMVDQKTIKDLMEILGFNYNEFII